MPEVVVRRGLSDLVLIFQSELGGPAPRPLKQPRPVGGDCEGIDVGATAKQWRAAAAPAAAAPVAAPPEAAAPAAEAFLVAAFLVAAIPVAALAVAAPAVAASPVAASPVAAPRPHGTSPFTSGLPSAEARTDPPRPRPAPTAAVLVPALRFAFRCARAALRPFAPRKAPTPTGGMPPAFLTDDADFDAMTEGSYSNAARQLSDMGYGPVEVQRAVCEVQRRASGSGRSMNTGDVLESATAILHSADKPQQRRCCERDLVDFLLRHRAHG